MFRSCPNLLRVVLLGLEITVSLPQLWRIWAQKMSTGLSLPYVFFNLLSATERFTVGFLTAVNSTIAGADPPGFFAHNPRTIGDCLNLVQLDALFPSMFHEPDERQIDFGVAIFAGMCSIIPQAIQLRSLSLDWGVVRVRDWTLQAVVLAMLAVSWLFRVRFASREDNVLTPFRSIAWFVRVGWPAGGTGMFAVVQGGLAVLGLLGRRRVVGGGEGVRVSEGETNPLLGGTRHAVPEHA
ncbi:uncharacterized protein BO95DRAFT_452683 [Aspergillus brunneoviolaceus CBS 621.78]|uniref:Uncharacterized protein n=1 Tax=Aspergillus brunneoviolaceus CBS 621.78 TaxID=1450534 RepID=A0ACD1GB39_9EURO|nr:hypothetical protein BO95DRAFT_452683 [Aspergillus brunneoviolaceus CBS 621.78]RAH46321.1 hypothetical protein BO95DRAFT_452683 [Aspergillus brunneoviolaceus CBS 621.78]